MRIQIILPPGTAARSGNRRTADQWAAIMVTLGHQVKVGEQFDEQGPCDVVVALHGAKTHREQLHYRGANRNGILILALTGTDIYPEPDVTVRAAMQGAERLVVLQPNALKQIPESMHGKTSVIIQSAEAQVKRHKRSDDFDVCVVGHFRPAKDPLLAARAVVALPADSRVQLYQAGAIVEKECSCQTELETLQEHPRYTWLGEVTSKKVHSLVANSRLMILTSRFEGGANVIGESIVEGTPVLATRIDATEALLGADYPGLFEVGNQEQLTELIHRAATDTKFYASLKEACAARADQFLPEREAEAWRVLLADLMK
ncbi:MAG: putative glycosyltransferase (TIGR04348 family) [Candidatus Omnitrophota bacterium]|jgi:putative glycosyltransferase (TIGR04348 family)